MASTLGQLRRECLERLGTLGTLARVPLLAEDRGVVAEQIARALAWDGRGLGRCGAFCFFLVERATIAPDVAWSPMFSQALIGVHCVEAPELNRTTNGTGLPALELAEVVMGALHLFRPRVAAGPLMGRGIEPVEFDLGNGTVLPGFHVLLDVPGFLGQVISEIAPVLISQDAEGRVVMSCATDGVRIFFTTDLSRPNMETGVEYTVPVEGLAAGTVVRARAFLSGYLLAPVSEYVVIGGGASEGTILTDENGVRLTDENGNLLTVPM
jgi:hypothetical protein